MSAAPTMPDLRQDPPSKNRSSIEEYFAVRAGVVLDEKGFELNPFWQ